MPDIEKIREIKRLAFTLLNTCKSEISEEDRESLIQSLASTSFNLCLRWLRENDDKK